MKSLLLSLGGLMISASISQAGISKPSESFRQEHKEIKKHLSHVEEWVGELSSRPREEQKETMQKIVSFFKEHIEPHAEWEERKLYPAVDKRTGKGPEAFTATMRYEHKVIGRWVGELEKEAGKKAADAKRFTRKTDQLLGLIKAHFEEEEEVLLPVLDKSMTPAQFKEEILSESGR